MASSARSLLTVNALIVASLLFGLLTHVAITAFFGLTRAVDAYYAALMLPVLFLNLCVDYLGKNFMPVLARARRESFAAASDLTSSVVTIVTLFAAAVALALVAVSGPLFSVLLPGFAPDEIELVSRYFWIMAPAMVMSAGNTFHQYMCQHDEDYAWITAIKSLVPVANCAIVVFLGPFLHEYSLAISYTVGQAIVYVLMGRRARYRYRPRIAFRKEWEGKIFSNSAIVMSSGFLARIRNVIGTYLSSQLGSGAVSALALGYRLIEPLERSAFTGVRMIMFSRVSRLETDKSTREVARLYDLGLRSSFMLLAPLLWWIGMHSHTIVELLFERGAFGGEMTDLVALAVIGFVPSVLLVGTTTILSNAFYAMDRVAVPALVMPLGTVVYLGFAPAVYRPWGVFGLALAPSVVALVMASMLLYFLARRVPELRLWAVVPRLLLYTALSGAVMTLLTVGIARFGTDPVLEAGLSLLIGGALYVALLAAARDRTLIEVYAYVRRAAPSRASTRGALS